MPYILGTRGLKRHFPLVISLFLDTLRYIATLRNSPDSIFSRKKMSSKRKEYHVDSHAKHAAIFFVACKPNPATFVKILSAMRAKRYSDEESKDKTMQMQVRWEIGKIKGAEATTTLLTLSAPSYATNQQALETITSVLPAAASVTASATLLAGILLPTPPRKTKNITPKANRPPEQAQTKGCTQSSPCLSHNSREPPHDRSGD